MGKVPLWVFLLAWVLFFLFGCYNPRIQLEHTTWQRDDEAAHRPDSARLIIDHYRGKYLRPYSVLQHSSDLERGGPDEPEENTYRLGLEVKLQ